MAWNVATASRNAALDAALDLTDAGASPGYIEIRTGSRPANANTAATGTILSTITCADPAWAAASGGAKVLDASPDLTDASADNTGTAGWGRVYDSTGAAICDGECGVAGSGKEFILTSLSVTAGQAVTILDGTITFPAS